MRILYECGYSKVNERWFINNDCFEIYRDAKTAIPPNMPEPSGHEVVVRCFVDANRGEICRGRKCQT